jgi:hypothetical protein
LQTCELPSRFAGIANPSAATAVVQEDRYADEAAERSSTCIRSKKGVCLSVAGPELWSRQSVGGWRFAPACCAAQSDSRSRRLRGERLVWPVPCRRRHSLRLRFCHPPGGLRASVRLYRCRVVIHQRGLTPRSTGRATAGHLGPVGGTRYIVANRAKASCRRTPVNSNVRHQRNGRATFQQRVRLAP